jgi:hypothetical protein
MSNYNWERAPHPTNDVFVGVEDVNREDQIIVRTVQMDDHEAQRTDCIYTADELDAYADYLKQRAAESRENVRREREGG